ncbi:MAG TPA: Hsp20/alpha crystallin family protein [Chryseolinea sp.]|jgi:HSP20 family protein|nr:Hsp20/alpha crystallin family protein [Chryseolinea sp.]
MALVRQSTWPTLRGSPLSDFFDDDRFFNSPWFRGQSLPAVNVKENDKAFEVELAAPGFDRNDFDISVDDGVLTVSGINKREDEKKGGNYTRREFGYSSFSRSFNLPANTSEEDIQAKYEEGVLKLIIAKKNIATAKPKRSIEIK